ncbi:hypothetical protein AB1Y20_021418 [Prymnesium parvum]|uniref:Uncharacterized protein n=1 Tax=Prymnesium parvum TaxID=97485 RepID=A0AB34JJQ4_PRYPA
MLLLGALCAAGSFLSLHGPHRLKPHALRPPELVARGWRNIPSIVALVSEDDVEAAVEKAEKLWAQALEARKRADRLSNEAESVAEEVSLSAQQQTEKLDNTSKFSLSLLQDAQSTIDASLEVGQLVSQAVDAAEEAEQLEREAEAALLDVEAAIAQHEIDFPDSSA